RAAPRRRSCGDAAAPECHETQSESFICPKIMTIVVFIRADDDLKKRETGRKDGKYYSALLALILRGLNGMNRIISIIPRGWGRPVFRASLLPRFWGDL
ncbi:MAG TPA: hypothetical protein VFS27_03170, partial [Blastocatellia bacterium]|nr:hypothetical protein [Blastocatellia bacterium]